MAEQEYPVFNGVASSFADLKLTVGIESGPTLDENDIAAVNYGSTVERGQQKKRGRVHRTTSGDVTNEGSITLYMSGWKKLKTALAAKSTDTVGNDKAIRNVPFNLAGDWSAPGDVDITSFEMLGCRINGRTVAAAEGPDAQQVEIPLYVAHISEDGVTL